MGRRLSLATGTACRSTEGLAITCADANASGGSSRCLSSLSSQQSHWWFGHGRTNCPVSVPLPPLSPSPPPTLSPWQPPPSPTQQVVPPRPVDEMSELWLISLMQHRAGSFAVRSNRTARAPSPPSPVPLPPPSPSPPRCPGELLSCVCARAKYHRPLGAALAALLPWRRSGNHSLCEVAYAVQACRRITRCPIFGRHAACGLCVASGRTSSPLAAAATLTTATLAAATALISATAAAAAALATAFFTAATSLALLLHVPILCGVCTAPLHQRRGGRPRAPQAQGCGGPVADSRLAVGCVADADSETSCGLGAHARTPADAHRPRDWRKPRQLPCTCPTDRPLGQDAPCVWLSDRLPRGASARHVH